MASALSPDQLNTARDLRTEHVALRADAVTLLNALDRMSRREHLSVNVKQATEQLRHRLGIRPEVDPDDEWQGP